VKLAIFAAKGRPNRYSCAIGIIHERRRRALVWP
jgi:hypothetical protein